MVAVQGTHRIFRHVVEINCRLLPFLQLRPGSHLGIESEVFRPVLRVIAIGTHGMVHTGGAHHLHLLAVCLEGRGQTSQT